MESFNYRGKRIYNTQIEKTGVTEREYLDKLIDSGLPAVAFGSSVEDFKAIRNELELELASVELFRSAVRFHKALGDKVGGHTPLEVQISDLGVDCQTALLSINTARNAFTRALQDADRQQAEATEKR